MSATITIPPQLVSHARAGAMYLLGLASDEIGRQTDLTCPMLGEPLRRFDTIRSLLDALPFEPETPAHVDPALAPALREALTEDMDCTADIAETNRNEGLGGIADEISADLPELWTLTATLGRECGA